MARRTRSKLSIRLADLSEHAALEDLMFAASVAVEAQREALLADPSINSFPAEQIADGRVYVGERGGEVVGFFAVLRRKGWRRDGAPLCCTSWPTRTLSCSTAPAVSRHSANSKPCSISRSS